MVRLMMGLLASAVTVGAVSTVEAQTAGVPARGPRTSASLWMPGGEEVAKAVDERRGKTELSRLAETMKPGTWAELETEQPAGLWSSPKIPNPEGGRGRGGLHIAGWTDDAHWDSRTGQLLYMGLRQTRQFIAYSEEKNAWRVIPLDRQSDNPVFDTNTGHIYSTNGFDHDRSRFYHLHRNYKELVGGISYFDAVTEKWTKLPPKPAGSGGMCIEHFAARDSLVVLGKEIFEFSHEKQTWQSLGPSQVDGYHAMLRHNPYRKELLFGGGNNHRNTVVRLKKDGTVERLKDSPVGMGIGSDRITIDPASGRYLIWAGEKDQPKKLYEFDSDKNEYITIDEFAAGWPFNRYAMPVMAFIPEHGVTIWAEKSVHLYKHDTRK